MKFLYLTTLLCLLSMLLAFRITNQSFLKEGDDELNLIDNNSNVLDNHNNELQKEDTFDNDNQVNKEVDLNDSAFDQQALQNEIHKDLGSERVSYKFDD
jgi:hypothetical protein